MTYYGILQSSILHIWTNKTSKRQNVETSLITLHVHMYINLNGHQMKIHFDKPRKNMVVYCYLHRYPNISKHRDRHLFENILKAMPILMLAT